MTLSQRSSGMPGLNHSCSTPTLTGSSAKLHSPPSEVSVRPVARTERERIFSEVRTTAMSSLIFIRVELMGAEEYGRPSGGGIGTDREKSGGCTAARRR